MTAGSDAGLVACGHEDERRPDAVVASEFQIFQCGNATPLLEFDALQTAVLRRTARGLHVMEVERWPFGPNWEWVDVPVYEWHLASEHPRPQARRTLLPRAAATAAAIDALISTYKEWLAVTGDRHSYGSADEFVGRLFAAAVAGDREAESLFLTMSTDAALDGAAAEAYTLARRTYAAWTGARPRHAKH